MSIRLQALPAMAELWDQLVQLAAAQGIVIDVADYGGFRTAADTAEILNIRENEYAQYLAQARANNQAVVDINTWRRIAPYGQSYHNYGAARDPKIVSVPAGMSGLTAVATIDNLAESLGLETGASYGDPLHVQLPIALDEAAGEWNDYVAAGGDASTSSSAGTVAALAIVGVTIGAVIVARYAKGIQTWH